MPKYASTTAKGARARANARDTGAGYRATRGPKVSSESARAGNALGPKHAANTPAGRPQVKR
jgi:hypothetical protein